MEAILIIIEVAKVILATVIALNIIALVSTWINCATKSFIQKIKAKFENHKNF